MTPQPQDWKRDLPGYLGLGLLLGALGARLGGQLMGFNPHPVVLGLLLGVSALLLVIHLYLNLSRSAFLGGAQNIMLSVMFLAVLVVLFLFAQRNPKRWDFLYAYYTLSQQSKAVARSLKDGGQLVVLYPPGSQRNMVLKLARQYAAENPKLRVLAVDINDPAVKSAYKIDSPDANGQMLVRLGSKTKSIFSHELYEMGQEPMGQPGKETFRGEEAITKALLSLKQQRGTHVCFLSGHGQYPMEGAKTPLRTAQELMHNDLYEIRAVNLVREGRVPGDCNVLADVGSQTDLSSTEKDLLLAFFAQGGRLMVSLAKNPAELPNWRLLLNDLGMETVPGLLIDPYVRDIRTNEAAPITFALPLEHPVSEAVKESSQLVQLMRAHGLRIKGESPGGLSAVAVLQSTPSTYADKAAEAEHPLFTAGDDKRGPFDVAVAVARPSALENRLTKEGRLLVVGGPIWLVDSELSVWHPNQQLFLSALGWLSGSEVRVKARPKPLGAQASNLSPNQTILAWLVSLLLLPLAFLAIAGFAWSRARGR